jgi:hypothetical protein
MTDTVSAQVDFEAVKAPVQYLTNKEFLAEIHKSKLTYCSYEKPEHGAYDAIVASVFDITPEFIEETKAKKAHQTTQAGKKVLRDAGRSQTEIKAYEVLPESISAKSLIFRVMTSQHIPLDPHRKRKGKGENGNHTRTPFLPFKHFYVDDDGSLVEVLRSHWEGTITDGKFNMTKGKMTSRLASMYILLVDRYSRLSNWRGYTYLDEMKNNALLQLSQIGLQFDEFKSDNPFAFYTTTVKNCFTHVLNKEKRGQNMRDDILIMNGASPSYTRQNDLEYERGMRRHMEGGFGEVTHTIMEGYEHEHQVAAIHEEDEFNLDVLNKIAELEESETTDEVAELDDFDNGITFPDEDEEE